MSKSNSFPRRKGHKPECMCAGCEFPPANSPRRLSPAPAPTSPSESVAAPAEVGQVMGTTEFVISQILFPFLMLVGLGLCAFVNLYFLGGVLRFLLEQGA